MRISDVVMALLAVLLLAGFLAILVWKVPETPLIIVAVLGVAMAAFDLIGTTVRHRSTRRADREA